MNLSLKKLYLSTFINSFGSWLTFLAIALLVKEKYGGQQVAWIFLVQTLPAILFSRSLAQLIPEHQQERFYWISQVLLAVNCLVLCFVQSLPILYVHLFIAAFLKSASNPLFNTLAGRWAPSEKVDEVFTKIGSIQTATLALAPIAGAWIKIVSSAEMLFFIDALSFIVSVVLLKELLFVKAREVKNTAVFKLKDLFSTVIKIPKGVPSSLWRGLLLWFGFLILGALVNALEFSKFEQLQMDERMIGYALGAWGLGSLIAFIKKWDVTLALSGAVFLGALAFFFMTPSVFGAIAVFIVGGWASSVFSGMLRGQVQKSVPSNFDALPVWAFANQITQVINLIAYTGVGLLLSAVGFNLFTILVVLVGIGIQTAILWPTLVRKLEKMEVLPWT
jgi:MFS family permease